MNEMLLWLENLIVVALSEFIEFMSYQISAPLWLLLVTFMAGALSVKIRGASGGMSRAYQKIKVRWNK